MKTYGQYCPVALAAEALTERWTLLVVLDLLAGSRRFNDFRRGVPRMSLTLLSKRLVMLERLGLLDKVESADGSRTEYRPTDAAEELRPIVEQLGAWSVRWIRGPTIPDEHLDAGLLMWDMQNRVVHDRLPDRRIVIRFHLTGSTDGRSHFWLVLDGHDVDLCTIDPGYDVDLRITGHVRDPLRYWMGDAELDDLIARPELTVTGDSQLRADLPHWFERNQFASTTRPADVGAGPGAAHDVTSPHDRPGRES